MKWRRGSGGEEAEERKRRKGSRGEEAEGRKRRGGSRGQITEQRKRRKRRKDRPDRGKSYNLHTNGAEQIRKPLSVNQMKMEKPSYTAASLP